MIAAIDAGVEIDTIVTATELLHSSVAWRVVAEQRANGCRVIETSGDVFRSLSLRDHPQGLLCIGRQRWHQSTTIPAPRGLGWVGLLEPRDPGNLGTILRVCDAVGCEAVFVLGTGAVDPYHPVSLRAAMGSTFAMPMVRNGFDDFVSLVTRHDVPLIGASDDAAAEYRACDLSGPIALLMGREATGMPGWERGYDDAALRKIGHENWLRVLEAT